MSDEVVEHVKLAEEEDGVSEKEGEVGLQCRESFREDEVIDDENGCVVKHQDEVIGQLIQEIAVIDLNEQKRQLGNQCQEIGSPICSPEEGKCEETEEQQVKVTEQQLQHGEQSREIVIEKEDRFVIEYRNGSPEPQYEGEYEDSFVIEYRKGSPELQNEEEDGVNEEMGQNQTQVTEEKTCNAPIEGIEQHREYGWQSQESLLADLELGLRDEQQNEVISQQMQEIAVAIEEQDTVEEMSRVTEEQVKASEHWLEYGKVSQEPVEDKQHSFVIDKEDGFFVKQNVQQDVVNEEESQEQMQVTALTVEDHDVEVENRLHSREEQHTRVIVGENVCPDELQGEVMEHQVQNQMQEIALIVEKHNALVNTYEVTEQQRENEHQDQVLIQEVQKYKVREAQVQATEQQRGHEQKSREPMQEEQPGKMAEDENGSPNEQQGEVNKGRLLILEEYQVTGEQVEVTKQETEHGQQNQEQKDEVKGQRNQSLLQVTTEIVDNYNVAEPTVEVTEEHEVEVTEQQRNHGQQSQEEQNHKLIGCQVGYPKQQNELLDGVNGDQVHNQMQDTEMSVEKEIDAKLKYKAAEYQIEEQCHSTEQQCDVTEEHIECIKRQIQFQEEVVEGIDKLTRTEALQVENVSELQEQLELLQKLFNVGMQESFSKKQEKAAARAINSTPPLTSQKLSYHCSSTFYRESCLKLLKMTHKLQEKTLKVQESLLDLLATRELSHTISKDFMYLEGRTMPIADSCGEREYIDCGFPAQMKQGHIRQQCSPGKTTKTTSESDCRLTQTNCQELEQEQRQRDPEQEKSKKFDREAVEFSGQTQQHTGELAQERQLRSKGQRQSKSESLLTTSMELSPRRDQDVQLRTTRVTEKPKKLKRSAEKTGQTQLQQWQLRPRGKIMSTESIQATTSIARYMEGSSPSKPVCHEQHQLISSIARSQVQKPGITETAQMKKQQANHCNQQKRGTPEPTTLPNAIGPILPCKKPALSCQNVELPTPEACEEGPTVMDKSSQPVVRNTGHHDQEKIIKSKPTTMAETPHLNFPLTAKELQQKQLCRMSLRSHSQAASQSELELPSEHHSEKPQEMKHQGIWRPKLNSHNQHNGELQPPNNPEQPRKPRGRPAKRKRKEMKHQGIWRPKLNSHNQHNGELQPPNNPEQPRKPRGRPAKRKRKLDVAATEDVSLPAKYRKLQEGPKYQRQEKPSNELMSCSPPKHPEQRQKRSGRRRKLDPDNDLVKNYHMQRNLRSHKREEELQLPKQPEQQRKPRGRPAKRKLDMAAAEYVSLPAKYKLQEEPRNQKQKKERSPNAHHEELQPLKHPEQPQKRKGRPKKLNPDDELVKNCCTQRNLRSHKREEELQLPKQPEQSKNPKTRRGRPCNLIQQTS